MDGGMIPLVIAVGRCCRCCCFDDSSNQEPEVRWMERAPRVESPVKEDAEFRLLELHVSCFGLAHLVTEQEFHRMNSPGSLYDVYGLW